MTTPDTAGFRLAVAADPTDLLARDAYLDFLQERADEGDAAAGVRAEFIRVQEAIEKPGAISPHIVAMVREWSAGRGHLPEEGFLLQAAPSSPYQLAKRERELLAAHEATWRTACACRACGGKGNNRREDPQSPCAHCFGGDVGGLLRLTVPENTGDSVYRHPVEFRRGHVCAVECTPADVLERGFVPRPDDSGKTYRNGEWHPTAWAKAVTKWFPVTEFRVGLEPTRVVTDERAHNEFRWFRGVQPNIAAALPEQVFDALEGGTESKWAWLDEACRPRDTRKRCYETRELARTAHARAVARVVRAR